MSSTKQIPTGTWQIDTSATSVTVTVKKMGMITVPATLTVTSGTIEINEDNQVSSVEIVADAASYASKNSKRNEHVLGADFLATETYPTITLSASAATATADGYTTNGSVTVKGKTSPIEFSINDVKVDGTKGSFTASAKADRKAIGVDKMPTFIIGGNLDIDVSAAVTMSAN